MGSVDHGLIRGGGFLDGFGFEDGDGLAAFLFVGHGADDFDPGHFFEFGGFFAEVQGDGVGAGVCGAALDEHAEDAEAVAVVVVDFFGEDLGDGFDGLAGEDLLDFDVAASVVDFGDVEDEVACGAFGDLGFEVGEGEAAKGLGGSGGAGVAAGG